MAKRDAEESGRGKLTRKEHERVVLIFEGRDAAGKGGTIKRIIAPLNPRGARVVALGTPAGGRLRAAGPRREHDHPRRLLTATSGAPTGLMRSWPSAPSPSSA
jgi:hypothetical protein